MIRIELSLGRRYKPQVLYKKGSVGTSKLASCVGLFKRWVTGILNLPVDLWR